MLRVIVLVALVLQVSALLLPYDTVNQQYQAKYGVNMPNRVSSIIHRNEYSIYTRSTGNSTVIAEAKRLCGTDDYVSAYDVQRFWKTIYLETLGDATQEGRLYFINSTTGFIDPPGIPLSGQYNGSLVCSASLGCVGVIDRVIDFFGTPIPDPPVEQTILVFKRTPGGFPAETCVVNSDVESGLYLSKPIGRNVQHPDALISMDATLSGVGGTAGPDAGLNFNWWQTFQEQFNATSFINRELIRTVVWGVDNSALGTKDQATFLILLNIEYELSEINV